MSISWYKTDLISCTIVQILGKKVYPSFLPLTHLHTTPLQVFVVNILLTYQGPRLGNLTSLQLYILTLLHSPSMNVQ